MDVKGEVLLQLFYKRKLRNRTKTYLEQKFFSINTGNLILVTTNVFNTLGYHITVLFS